MYLVRLDHGLFDLIGGTYWSIKDGSVLTGDMAWSSVKNIDTSVRCSLWIVMYHSGQLTKGLHALINIGCIYSV